MPIRMSWSLCSPTLNELVDEAKLCERVGLDGVWFPDYQAPFAEWPELLVTLTSIASQTSKAFVGSLVTDFLRRHPMVVAHAFASLSHIAPNRVILGLGAGAGTSHRPFGISMAFPAKRLREGIEVVRALLSATPEKRAEYSGRHFTLRGAGPPMGPASKIPIYVASYGPKMLSLTARLADGWVPESHTPLTYRETLARIHREMRSAGREPAELEPCAALIFYPYKPDGMAYARLLKAAKNYLAAYPDILWAAGVGKGHPGLRTHQVVHDEALWAKLADTVPDWLAEATLVYGSVNDCVEKLRKFVEAGCGHIILEPYWIERDRLKRAVELAGREIKPLVLE